MRETWVRSLGGEDPLEKEMATHSSILAWKNPMDCSTPGLPIHHQLPEFTQTHVHWVSDAIQPPHPLSSPSPPALNFSMLCIDIYNHYVFLLNWSLDHYVVSFLIACNLYFKVYFVLYEGRYSSFLLLPISMEYIFPSSHFQFICDFRFQVGFFCIHSAILCLLVGAFNPITFKAYMLLLPFS